MSNLSSSVNPTNAWSNTGIKELTSHDITMELQRSHRPNNSELGVGEEECH